MNERIEKLVDEAIEAIPDHADFELPKEFTKKFAELLLKDAFAIIKEAMIDSESEKKVDEVIANRLGDAAYDVCDQLGLIGPIYEG